MNPVTKALKAYDEAARSASEANKKQKEASAQKAQAKAVLLATLEEAELDSASATLDGQKLLFSRYDLPFAKIEDREKFRAWAETEDESYFEPEQRVREDLLNQLVRQRLDDGEALPPGVGMYVDTRLSRRAK